ncbi:MAG: hypothetical protein LBQ54_05625 [Planctomycetaceae bacterium]|jgi:hypothetical protein|nr:hypothetical protein [Planctomycetaceae bacterium]
MATNEIPPQVKSKKRVADHGEVYTSPREVNAMLDLVKQETERIESRFLEPACGNGNFLAEVLRRKLTVVKSRYAKSQPEFERYAVLAVSSIYGVDILEDNVNECRERLFRIFDEKYRVLYKKDCKEECRRSVRFLLKRNILCGNALTLKDTDDESIVFAEWSPVNGSMMKRRDFSFSMLLYHSGTNGLPLFAYANDMGEDVFIPEPVREFPPVHFLELEGMEDCHR